MKEIPIPAETKLADKKQNALRRNCLSATVFFFVCAALAILSLIGLLVTVVVFELRGITDSALFPILASSFAGGALIFALLAFALSKLTGALSAQHKDFVERRDGQESFFVGEGVLATFEQDALCIHGLGGGQVIWVPYAQMRIFSVCTRRAPREKGEWSVVFEIPAHYLAKKPEKNAPPALVQTDAKERLYRAVEKHGLTLLGEQPPQGKPSSKKFSIREKYILPDRPKRRRALIGLIAGAVVAVGGVAMAIFWQTFIGSLLVAVGIVFVMRSIMSFVRAKAALCIYDEGILWQNIPRTDSFFLKWEEIERITPTEHEGMSVLKLVCLYGDYHIPKIEQSLACIKKMHPELL